MSGNRDAAANLKAAEAAVASARLNLDYTKVRSPVAGRVGRAEVTVGNLVIGLGGANATLLTTVVSLDPIYAYFEGDEQVYLKYGELARAGERPSSRTTRTPIYLGLASEQGHPHKGYVDFVDNQLNPQTGTIRARAVFDNKDRVFTPGLFARLKLVGSGTYDAILINDRAIGTDQSKKFVLVVGADNKAMYREVKLGPVVDGLRVVKQGLKPGEVIVVNGLQRVRPGEPVTPQRVPMEGSTEATAAAAGTGTSAVRTRDELSRNSSSTGRASPRCCPSSFSSPVCWRSVRLPISEYPEVVPPSVSRARAVSGRQPESHRGDGRRAAGRADQRRGEHALHVLAGDHRRSVAAHRDVQARNRRRQRAGAGAEPSRRRRCRACRKRCAGSA